jgi:hypothetical protein
MRAIGIKIEDDFEQERDDYRAGSAIAQQLSIAIEKLLVDAGYIASAKFRSDKFEKAPCSVEYLPDTGWRKGWPDTWKVNIKASIEVFAQTVRHRWVRDGAKMHSDMASARILAENSGAKIPTGVAVTGQSITAESWPQRRGRQHRSSVGNTGLRQRGNSETHRRTSGGK